MTDSEKLHQCFETLNEHLYRIRNSPINSSYAVKEHAISSIISGGIFGVDPEDALQFILVSINSVEELVKSIPLIISEAQFEEQKINPFDEETVPALNLREMLQREKEEELQYYKIELEKLEVEIGNRIDNLGSNKLSNAGFKVTLNMTVEEMGALFGAFFDTRLITPLKSEGNPLKKQELAEFIVKNFRSKQGRDISAGNMRLALSKKDSNGKVSNLLTGIKKHLNDW